jgi:hypothetical protein
MRGVFSVKALVATPLADATTPLLSSAVLDAVTPAKTGGGMRKGSTKTLKLRQQENCCTHQSPSQYSRPETALVTEKERINSKCNSAISPFDQITSPSTKSWLSFQLPHPSDSCLSLLPHTRRTASTSPRIAPKSSLCVRASSRGWRDEAHDEPERGASKLRSRAARFF